MWSTAWLHISHHLVTLVINHHNFSLKCSKHHVTWLCRMIFKLSWSASLAPIKFKAANCLCWWPCTCSHFSSRKWPCICRRAALNIYRPQPASIFWDFDPTPTCFSSLQNLYVTKQYQNCQLFKTESPLNKQLIHELTNTTNQEIQLLSPTFNQFCWPFDSIDTCLK